MYNKDLFKLGEFGKTAMVSTRQSCMLCFWTAQEQKRNGCHVRHDPVTSIAHKKCTTSEVVSPGLQLPLLLQTRGLQWSTNKNWTMHNIQCNFNEHQTDKSYLIMLPQIATLVADPSKYREWKKWAIFITSESQPLLTVAGDGDDCRTSSCSVSPSILTRTTPDLSTISWILCPFLPIIFAAISNSLQVNFTT